MRKINILRLSLFSSVFLIGFITSYKNSSKIRESVRIGIIWAILTISPISAKAKSCGLPGADGFTPPAQSRPVNNGLGLFDRSKPQNQNQNQDPGSDKPGGDGSNGDDNNSKLNSHHCHEPINQSDNDSTDIESESDWSEDSDWNKEDSAKSLFVTASDNREVELSRSQLRDKAHHLDVFPNIKIPKTFDLAYVKKLDYKSRLKYVRDRNKLPEKTIFAMQFEASKFFRSTQTKAFSGSLGRNKIGGTVYINERTRTVAFVNNSNSRCRTIIKMSGRQLRGLRERNYNLFPNI